MATVETGPSPFGEQVSAVLDAIPALCWELDASGKLVRANAAWHAYSGIAPRVIPRSGWRCIVHPDDHPRATRGIRLAVKRGAPFQDRLRFRRNDNLYREHLALISPVRGAGGAITGWVGIAHDVQDQRDAEAAVQAQLAWHRLALDAAHLVGWDWDVTTGHVRRDGDVDGLIGPVGETQDDFLEIVHPDDRDRVRATLDIAMRPGGSEFYAVEYRYLHRTSSETRWAEDRGRVIRDAEGRALRVYGVMADVTPRRLLEARLREVATAEQRARDRAEEARRSAEDANQAKSRFLANMSHELRTPLNAIVGFSELLTLDLYGPVTPRQSEALGRIRRAASYLLALINDVLNLSKIETGRLNFRFEIIDTATVLRDAVTLVEQMARDRGVELELDAGHFPPRERRLVVADEDKFRQVVLNLLSNAVKFTPSGGQVRVRAEWHPPAGDHGPTVLVHVEDTGIGIAEDELSVIFDPFVQAQGGLTREHQGAGLGLAISRDLARGMGGDLTVHSTLGEGSVFTVRLRASALRDDLPADRRLHGDRRHTPERRHPPAHPDAGTETTSGA